MPLGLKVLTRAGDPCGYLVFGADDSRHGPEGHIPLRASDEARERGGSGGRLRVTWGTTCLDRESRSAPQQWRSCSRWGSVAAPAEGALTGVSRVDVSSSGAPANGPTSGIPDTTTDGRYVAFLSAASNLVEGDTNGLTDVFLRDRTAGTTRLVSAAGVPADGESLGRVSVSDDGRFVVFSSEATNLAGGAPGSFLRDMVTGGVTRIASFDASISANGRYVVYRQADGIVRLDRVTGQVRHVSGGGSPAISGSGRFVVTRDLSSNLEYLFTDMVTGRTRDLLARAKSSPDWGWDDDPSAPVLSTNGRYVAFVTDASGLVPADAGESDDIYLVDTAAGDAYLHITREQANDISWSYPDVSGFDLALSGNGRVLAFKLFIRSLGNRLVAFDRVTGLMSAAPGVTSGDESAALDGTGSRLVYQTESQGLRVGTVPECTILGTSGADVLTGTPGADVICGREGNDVIEGRGGDDLLAGGTGRDTVSFLRSNGPVVVQLILWRAGGAGQDELHGFESVDGSAFGDRIAGEERDNRLRGLGGADELIGDYGRDSLVGGPGSDTCDGGPNVDVATSCESVINVP
jgi:Ca2+-binding RTX toxin-like protein